MGARRKVISTASVGPIPGSAADAVQAPSRSRRVEFEGFGCPRDGWPAHVSVKISDVRGDEVRITENFGIRSHITGEQEEVERCVLPRARWNAIADTSRREFNERLRSHGLPPGAWKPGTTKVERMLGQELILLACACSAAEDGDVLAVTASWAALRPEERWWFAGWIVARSSPRVMLGAALLLSGGPMEESVSEKKPLPSAKRKPELPLLDALLARG